MAYKTRKTESARWEDGPNGGTGSGDILIKTLRRHRAAKAMRDRDPGTMILAEGIRCSLDCRKTRLNNHVLAVGASGSGKTRGLVIPNLLEASGSYIVSDPKGNLYRKYKPYLESRGYEVKCVDFIHPERSIGYNPLQYIRSTQDVVKMSNMLVYQQVKVRTLDPFWDDAGSILLGSLIAYLLENQELRQDMRTLENVIKLLCAGRRGENPDGKTTLETLMENYSRRNPDSWAYKQFEKVNVAANRTFDSILITLTAKLRNFDTLQLNQMLQKDEVHLSMIGQQKTAVFVVVSDTDRSMDNLANLFFTQAMNELCLYADEECEDNCLPVPVRFILDDFATNCRIEEFPRMISSIRSRGISAMLMLQSEGQLKEGYGSDGKTIIGNCDTYVYLGGNDVETARAVAERCDLPLRSLLYMPVGECWIFRRGQEPVKAHTLDLDQYVKELQDLYEELR